MKCILICSLILFGSIANSFENRVRYVEVQPDQVVTVKTAIGIATIVQVPDSPNSVVVGDQSAFKVEYLDKAITIKPLVSGAKSNLYIYTEWKRYNVQLITGAEVRADYVVYLKHPKKKEDGSVIAWRSISKKLTNDDISLEVTRVGNTSGKFLFLEFQIISKQNRPIKPEWIWLTQEGVTKPINKLIFSSLTMKKGEFVKGVIQLAKEDIDVNAYLRFELRRKTISYLTIAKASAWKTK
ncbi:MAG: hypothetical protein A2504_13060 [Bdellovibrionales bacterium RIFOXYD12_FULL_39_22]|nr:MAG: hypothetical protein A2385_00860 [Bdellovibrionales bacterium RIFOXYB1_FULL_39_21]OFZ43558.1 MAG: hypothetical protein A2485_12530 [Bdellovibrionales bacterium RIFOXYC12_FULL_39_17]OFZ44577.1 MAG: hypothetical protein A2404_10220 [Bdellovibrionales bacterium RIFOXYC1_FULL_39_130]OFZ76336.1 MAG: hypothetical protein A2560_06840 [Bdellovibrionales bacterium RIFOXYD1_FULL_39_84]OFZ94602.1 MAG: hypothetical protein A2504_13060 [Bdellovibrionales bacterium RIFOXYD12_FULL_39_22]HLE12944.1 Tr